MVHKLFTKILPSKHIKAQGLVEFALALPIFLLAVFGVIEFGRLLSAYVSVYTAAREAARYGAAVGDDGNNLYRDCAGIRAAAQRIGFIAGVDKDEDIVIQYYHGIGGTWDSSDVNECPGNVALGDQIAVKVTGNYTPVVPLVNIPSIPITSISSRTLVTDVSVMGIMPTPIPSPTPDCSYLSSTPAGGSQTDITSSLKNDKPAIQITAIKVNWNNNTSLNKIYLNNIQVWSGSSPSPSAIIPLPLTLPSGTTPIKFTFSGNIASNKFYCAVIVVDGVCKLLPIYGNVTNCTID